MKNIKLVLVAAVLAVGSAVQADYLYWMVGDTVGGQSISGDAYATLNAVDTEGQIGDKFYYKSNLEGIYGIADVSSYADDTTTQFYVNVYSEADELLYSGMKDNTATYADLSQYIRPTMDAAVSESGTSYWNAAPIPEPTGGVLLLLGAALLGLRRKRVEG